MARARPGDGAAGPFGLLALLIGLAGLGLLLWQLDGPPRIASGSPDWAHIRTVLGGSELTDADAITAAATIAWVALAYLAFAVALRSLLLLAERVTGGARWARAALRLSNLVTIPSVRRVVDGGLAGTLLLASWLPDPSRIAVAAETAVAVATAPAPPALVAAKGGPDWRSVDEREQSAQFVEYTVVRGDYLWDIARRFYDDGSRFVEIFEANRDRAMPGGERFTDPALIRPGWVLQIPLPARNLSVDGEVATYRVRRGDHLWGIAERLLGDGFRWVEIWERNRGHEMDSGRPFTDPSLIYPGWLLQLPIAVTKPVAPPSPAAGPGPLEAEPPSADPSPEVAPPGRPTAEPAVNAESEHGGGWSWEWPSLPRPVLLTAAGFALIGGTAVFVQRLARSGRLHVPGARRSAHEGEGDATRVTLATRTLTRALADYGFGESRPLLVREAGRRQLEFTVQCPAGDAEALVAHGHDLERRLACEVEAEVLGSTRVLMTLSGFQRLAALLGDGAEGSAPALVVPVGGDDEGIVYVDLAAVGCVAVGGSEGERRQLLRSWFATLTTTHAPQELALHVDAATAALLGEASEGPHMGGATPPATVELIEELEELLRSRAPGSNGRPVLAFVEQTREHEGMLDGLLREGPRAGVFVVSGMTAEDAAGDQTWPASVIFPHPEDDLDDEEARGAGAIALTVGRDRPLFLDPVTVRRDTSARWAERAEAGEADPFVEPAEGPDLAADPGAVEPVAGESALLEPNEGVAIRVLDEGGQADASPEPEPDGAASPLDDSATFHTVEEDETPSTAEEPNDLSGAAERDAQGPTESAETSQAATDTGGASAAARQGSLFATGGLEPTAGDGQVEEPTFSVRCLGGFQVRARGRPVERWPLEKARELLAFLIAHGGVSVAREAAAEALWPGVDWDASLKHSMSNTTSTLRRNLRTAAGDSEVQPLIAIRQRLQLPSALFAVDLDAFDSALRRAAGLPDAEALDEYERALALYTGDFLEGEFFTWVDLYRLEYRQRLFAAARRAAGIAESLAEPARAAPFYRALFEREPTDETVARGLMRSLAASGDVVGARKVLQTLSEALRRELDDPRAAPSPETRALLAEMLEVGSDA